MFTVHSTNIECKSCLWINFEKRKNISLVYQGFEWRQTKIFELLYMNFEPENEFVNRKPEFGKLFQIIIP